MKFKAPEVFVPGSYPEHTYVARATEHFEQTLEDALSTDGQIVSLSGPSKSGKTVLVERVIGKDNLIAISGSSIKSPEDLWNKVLDWTGAPATVLDSTTLTGKGTVTMGVKGSVGFPGVAKAEGNTTGTGELSIAKANQTTHTRRGLPQVEKDIADSSFVVLIDDFHYMDSSVQDAVAKSLKEAVRLKIKLVTAAVSHRGDDIVRANNELRGRVRAIDLKYWSKEELKQISNLGFRALNAHLDDQSTEFLCTEASGSPQLMQQLCLQACFVLGLRETSDSKDIQPLSLNQNQRDHVMEQTSASTDFRSLAAVLDAGAPTRGTERKTYKFHDGTSGDVYRAVLKAVASDPPQLSLTYDDLLKRTQQVCDGESPVGSSVSGTCAIMSKLAKERFPSERALDWDEQKQVFDLPDPYLLFYLRWSEFLSIQQK